MTTDNIGLTLTGASETSMTFLEWRTLMNGTGNDSNMKLIDGAIGLLNTAIGQKADGFTFNSNTGVLQLTSNGSPISGASVTINLNNYYTKNEVAQLLDELEENLADSQEIQDIKAAAISELDWDEATRTLTVTSIDGETSSTINISGGGGGGSSDANTVKILNNMGSRSLTIMSSTETYSISASWSSKDSDNQATGSGTLSWYVNNVRVALQTNVPQGNITFPVRQYLSTGITNSVVLTVEDRDGYSKTFSWSITVSNVGLSWNIDDIAYHGSDSLTIRLTPTGAGEKTVVVTIDDETELYNRTLNANNNNTQIITVPAQEHGEHIIKAEMTIVIAGDTITTPALEHTGVWVESGETDKIVAIHKDTIETTQFETVPIKYMVIDPSLSNADDEIELKLKEGNNVVSTLGIAMSDMTNVQTWSYRANSAGETTLSIETGTSPNAVSDSIVIDAESIGYDISPVTTGLIMELDPTGHSNSEANRTSFGYKDGNNTNHPLTFSNGFDWQNGGFKQDSDGVTAFVIKRGSSVTFDRSLFLATDNTNGEMGTTGVGKHISFIFKTQNVTDYDTKIAHSYDSGVGIELYAHNATFRAGNPITCQYCEDYKVEMSLNINPTNASMKFWVAGTPAKGDTFLTSGGAKTQFVQGTPDNFTIGSNDCDIWVYNFKMYRTFLSDKEVLQNYIADCGNPTEMVARYLRNDIYDVDGNVNIDKLMLAAPDMHIITIETAGFPNDKGSAGNTPCKIIHQIGNGIDNDQWFAENAQYTLQGTSSMNYRQVAGNLDINMKKTTMKVSKTQETLTDGYAMTANSIPVKYFNLKANVASSENANNRCAAELFNTFNPLVSKAKSVNDKVRDTVEGHPCAVFIKNTGDSDLLLGVSGARTVPAHSTILYFVGDMNNSKKNTEVFGQTSTWDDENHKQCCIEFLENTYTRCTFKSHDFENEGWKESGTPLTSHFEFRYPDGAGTQAMKDNFIAMHAWVCSTDPEGATNENLDPSDRFGVYTKDTAEYRRAKFKREVSDYFNLDNLLYYYLFTEFLLGVDNRAKNMFLSYEPDENDVWRWNVSKFYDGDTILGIDNKGNFVWGEAYGIEDTDGYEEEVDGETVTHPYFNAAESVLWCNVRDCFFNELAEAYNTYENAGLFSASYLINMFDSYQRLRPEALMIEDYAGKYDAPITNAGTSSWMVDMEHGEKRLQRRQFLTYQEKYMSSKYVSAKSKADIIRYQAKPGANFSSALEITPYSDMYVGFLRDNTPAGKSRLKKGQTATVQCLDGNGNPLVLQSGELNVQLINGSNLKHIGGAQYLYPGQVSITNGAKLQDIILGDLGYTSANLSSVSFGTVPLVKVIDLRGQTGISGTIDLTSCTLLEELRIGGTGLTDLYLPQTNTLRVLSLGSNVKTLYARNIPTLTSANFACSSGNLLTVWIENAPGIDTATLLTNATSLVRGRITNVNWSLDNADLLLRLATLKGLDEQGNPLETAGSFYLSGTVNITDITEPEYLEITSTFNKDPLNPVLIVNYDNLVGTHTVTFKNDDGTVLNTQTVRDGGSARNPISSGLISTPTKTPTVDLVYTFAGWDTSINNITEDTIVTATYTSSTRRYTVNWWYDSTTLLYSEQIDARGSTAYVGEDLTPPTGQYWLGWDTLTNSIVADTDVTAVFVQPTIPDQSQVTHDYLYSDDPNDDSKYTIGELFGIVSNSSVNVKNYFNVGDRIKIVPSTNKFADSAIILSVVGFNHFKLADNSGDFAQAVFHMVGVMNVNRQMNSTNTNSTSWQNCSMRTYLNSTVFPALPKQWQLLIKEVEVLTSAGNTQADIVTTNDKLFLLSQAEVGFDTSAAPYKNEIDANAESKTFPAFTGNNSRIRKTYNGEGSAQYWWLRSPCAANSTGFCIVNTNGSADSYTATGSLGVAFGFCL